MRRLFFLGLLLFFSIDSLSEKIEKPIKIPVKNPKGAYTLNAWFLTDTQFVNPPLIVLTHGAPPDPSVVSKVDAHEMTAQGQEFLKLGLATLIVERRGFGHSKEKYTEVVGGCEDRDYVASAAASTADILGASAYARDHLNVDPNGIVLAGESAGGFVAIMATGPMQKGVRAALSFSGGRGFHGDHVICNREGLFRAYALAGSTSQVPSFWIYSRNDSVFPPDLAQKMFDSFNSINKKGTFVMLPPFEDEGHSLFGSPSGVPIWLPQVRGFLQKLKLCPLCHSKS